jgi:hypothetical protein
MVRQPQPDANLWMLFRETPRQAELGNVGRIQVAVILMLPRGVPPASDTALSARSNASRTNLALSKNARPCSVKCNRRVVRLTRRTPRWASSCCKRWLMTADDCRSGGRQTAQFNGPDENLNVLTTAPSFRLGREHLLVSFEDSYFLSCRARSTVYARVNATSQRAPFGTFDRLWEIATCRTDQRRPSAGVY